MYGEVWEGVRGWKSPKVQGFQGPGVPRSQGPKDKDISNSHSNTSLTLKKVHLVHLFATVLHYWEVGRGGVTAAIVTVQVWTPLAVVTVTSETRQSSSDVPILLRLRHKLSSVSTVSRKIFTVKKNIYNRIWVTADGGNTHKWLRICWHCFYLLSIVPVTTECNKIYLLMQCNFILNSTWKEALTVLLNVKGASRFWRTYLIFSVFNGRIWLKFSANSDM